MPTIPHKKLTDDDVEFYTRIHKDAAEDYIEGSLSYLKDADKKDRLKAKQCRFCFYFHRSRMAGQAFTTWSCGVCAKEDQHCNTAVPKVCGPCSDEYELCVECGADIKDRFKRRKSLK